MAAASPAQTRNARTALLFALIACGMLGLGFAAVPLYSAFCKATGFGGTARIDKGAEAPGAVAGKIISVRFDANVSPKLAWKFAPEALTQRVAVGARQMAFFDATNTSDHTITGTAAFNISPDQAAQYFVKVQCFCFTQQTLKPGETARMPVVFYVDPKLLDDPDARIVPEITLSYTFYPVDQPKAAG